MHTHVEHIHTYRYACSYMYIVTLRLISPSPIPSDHRLFTAVRKQQVHFGSNEGCARAAALLNEFDDNNAMAEDVIQQAAAGTSFDSSTATFSEKLA